MPSRLPTPCATPGCPALTRQRYCEAHRREQAQRYDAERGTAAQRGYGSRWRKLRAQVLREEPLCRMCAAEGKVTAAMDVDHRVPKVRGGTDERSNLQSMCHWHHSQKTAKEDGRWR